MDMLHAVKGPSRRSNNGDAWHGGENNNNCEGEPDTPEGSARPLT